MRTKSKDVFDFSNQLNYDVIALVETWLNDDFCDAEFFDLNLFAVYRKDRNVSRTGYSRGGGVLLAVKSQYKSNLCGLDDDSGLLDQIAVCINGLNLSVVLCLSYIPPGSSASIYSKHIDNIFAIEVSMGSKANICVMGDFNLPNICWSKFDDNHFLTPTNVNKDYEVNCIDTLLSLNLVQINHFSNQLHRFLDLIFVPNDFKFNVYECLAPISPSNLHHMPIVVEVGYFNFLKSSPSQNLALNYNVCDFNMLNSILGSIDWIKIFNDKTSSVCYDFFIEKVSDILKSNVPFKKNKPHKLPWYTTGLKKLKNLRNKFHKRFLAHGDPEDLVQCKHYQREFNFLNKFLYKQYILDKENEIKANPKSFWSYVNSKRKTSDIPSTLTYNGCTSKSGVDVVNMFASFFKSNFDSPVTSSAAVLDSVSAINLANISVSDEDVLDAIFNIKNSFKHDADGLCAYFLKKCSICVAPILTFIFNLSIKEGIFINRWKVASITPVFKGGRKDDVTCYRPIAKLSCVSKVFEHVIHKKLFFICKSFISPHQHGFFSGRSTSTNLVLFTEYCLSAFERGCQVEAIYTDLSKAFDKVSHSILLDKLQELGFHSNFLSWIASYLHNRVCTVKVESFVSSPYIQTSGVPQGSILGPLLFILFINGISSCFSTSRFLLYADDLKIFHKIESMSDVFDLQNDLDNLLSWCISNKLLINLSKCAHVSFYRLRHPIQTSFKIGNCVLKKSTSVRDLGVIFDFSLSFVPHIDYIIPDAYKVLAFIKRNCFDFSDPNTFKILYTTFVRSKLEYAAIIWDPYCISHIGRIERIQKLFSKFALRPLFPLEHPPYRSRCLLLGLQSLDCRRKFQSALFIFDLINNRVDSPDLLALVPFSVPVRSLRFTDLFSIKFHRCNYARNGPLTRSFLNLNRINLNFQKESKPSIDFSTSKEVFRSSLYCAFPLT